MFVLENYHKILKQKADNGTYTLQTDEIWSHDYVELHGCLQNKPFVMSTLLKENFINCHLWKWFLPSGFLTFSTFLGSTLGSSSSGLFLRT